MKKLLVILFLVFINLHAIGQQIIFEKVVLSNSIAIAKQIIPSFKSKL